MTETAFSEVLIRKVAEELQEKARRRLTEHVAADYLARGGVVPPTDEQQLADGWAPDVAWDEKARELSTEQLEQISEWYHEAFFQSAGSEDHAVADRSEAETEVLDELLRTLQIEPIEGSTLANLFTPGQRIYELDGDDFGELVELVAEEAARRGKVEGKAPVCVIPDDHRDSPMEPEILLLPSDVRLYGLDFVHAAVSVVLDKIAGEGPVDEFPEVKRLSPADVDADMTYVEVELTDGRVFPVRRETNE